MINFLSRIANRRRARRAAMGRAYLAGWHASGADLPRVGAVTDATRQD